MENQMVLKPKKRYKSFIIVLIIWSLIVLNWANADAIEFADFGPYRGKVVDADTREPIEGVVVLVEWHTTHFFAGSTLIDAQEILTDKNGEFDLPGILVLNPWTMLSAEAILHIYKSGYQAFKTGIWKKWTEFEASIRGIKFVIEDGKPGDSLLLQAVIKYL